jgi:hypothetical protein
MPNPTVEQLLAENAALKAQVAKQSTLRLKVSEKGAVSLYGISARFPATYYAGQWERIIAFAPQITKFIADNKSALSTKTPAEAA